MTDIAYVLVAVRWKEGIPMGARAQPRPVPRWPRAARGVLRLLIVAGLAVSTYLRRHLHLDLAGGYDPNTAAISEGALFRVDAALAVLAAVLVVVTRGRLGAVGVGVALLVAAGGVAVVVLYQYVDLGAVGPLPDMNEPISFPDKTASVIAEALAALAALTLLLWRPTRAPADPGRV